MKYRVRGSLSPSQAASQRRSVSEASVLRAQLMGFTVRAYSNKVFNPVKLAFLFSKAAVAK